MILKIVLVQKQLISSNWASKEKSLKSTLNEQILHTFFLRVFLLDNRLTIMHIYQSKRLSYNLPTTFFTVVLVFAHCKIKFLKNFLNICKFQFDTVWLFPMPNFLFFPFNISTLVQTNCTIRLALHIHARVAKHEFWLFMRHVTEELKVRWQPLHGIVVDISHEQGSFDLQNAA